MGDAMKFGRGQVLHLVTVAAALPLVSRLAGAQAYPTRSVRLVVPSAPGGAFDIVARLFGSWLSERLGQPFVIENRAGAGGNVGTELVVNAPPDGYTLLVVGGAHAINATLYGKLNFNFIHDITPIASIVRVPLVMTVNPSVQARSVAEFIAYAKTNPRKINMGSSGVGSSPHMSGELFKMMAGVDLVHVPYRGAGPAIVDLLGGQVQVMFATMPSSIEHIRAGRLRALAVTTATRSDALPDVAPVADFVPGYETSDFYGIGGPKNMPTEVVGDLNREVDVILANAQTKIRLADFGGVPLSGSPSDFAELIADETEKWSKVVKFCGAKAE
jgi:tripartite-type tricarboxylate transporter receptor subunit TctC